jgi:hypothetical protein
MVQHLPAYGVQRVLDIAGHMMTPLVRMTGTLSLDGDTTMSEGFTIALCVVVDVRVLV